jgi:sulfite oxidase
LLMAWYARRFAATLTAATFGISCGGPNISKHEAQPKRRGQEDARQVGGSSLTGEATYTADDVACHDGQCGRKAWVTYRDGVYDVTGFVKHHPGGAGHVRQAVGSAVDDHWAHWGAHHHSDTVSHVLEQTRVGRLVDDSGLLPEEDSLVDDVACVERHPLLLRQACTVHPFESESPVHLLAETQYTPAELFYVRNHASVPELTYPPDQHTIEFVDFTTSPPVGSTRTLAQLEAMLPALEVGSVLQCAGNRGRENIEMLGPSAFSGTLSEDTGPGLVSNARWSGLPLVTVLAHQFPDLQLDDPRAHLVLHGADGFHTSVPLCAIAGPDCPERASSCLLATHMNGEPLSPDHGYPVRVLLPGIVGARNVKWVTRIEVQYQESTSCWNQNYYKHNGESCMEYPINSIITGVDALADQDSAFEVTGIAYTGSGAAVARVEVTVDGGQTWRNAKLLPSTNAADISKGTMQPFEWKRWRLWVPYCEHDAEVWCRTIDTSGLEQPAVGQQERTQPENGYLYNGWHRVKPTAGGPTERCRRGWRRARAAGAAAPVAVPDLAAE